MWTGLDIGDDKWWWARLLALPLVIAWWPIFTVIRRLKNARE